MPRMGKLVRAALVSSIIWGGPAFSDTVISAVDAVAKQTSTAGNISFSTAGQLTNSIEVDGTANYTVNISDTTATPEVTKAGDYAIKMSAGRLTGTTSIIVGSLAVVESTTTTAMNLNSSGSGQLTVNNSGTVKGSSGGIDLVATSNVGAAIINNSLAMIRGDGASGINVSSFAGPLSIGNAGGTIQGATNYGVLVSGAAAGQVITNSGTIKGAQGGVNINSVATGGVTVNNSSTGSLLGTFGGSLGFGLQIANVSVNAPVSVTNAGIIASGALNSGALITLPGGVSTGVLSIANSGLIDGQNAGLIVQNWPSAGFNLTNTGIIQGFLQPGATLNGAASTGLLTLSNGGAIQSTQSHGLNLTPAAAGVALSSSNIISGVTSGISYVTTSNVDSTISITAGTVSASNGPGMLINPTAGTGKISISNAGTIAGVTQPGINVSTVGGGTATTSVINDNTITAFDAHALSYAVNGGQIVNNAGGYIVATGVLTTANAINLAGTNYTSFTNNTNARISAQEGTGLNLVGTTTFATTFVNEGTIEQVGTSISAGTAAMQVGGSLLIGALPTTPFVNQGTIYSANNTGILFSAAGSKMGGLTNQGLIHAANAVGFAIDMELSNQATPLINEGTIIGHIDLPATAPTNKFEMRSGSITGDIRSFASNNDEFIFKGGVIDGTIFANSNNVGGLTKQAKVQGSFTSGNVYQMTTLDLQTTNPSVPTILTMAAGKKFCGTTTCTGGNIAVTTSPDTGIVLNTGSTLDIGNGPFAWNATSTFVSYIGSGTSPNPALNPNVGKLKAGINLDFLAANKFEVKLDPNSYITNNASFRIIELPPAISVTTANFMPIVPSTVVLSFTPVADASGWRVTATRTNLDVVASTANPSTGSFNASSVGRVLESIAQGVSPDAGIVSIVASLSNAASVDQLVNQLQLFAPVANNDVSQSTMLSINQAENIVIRRLENTRIEQGQIKRIYSAGSENRYGTWGQFFNNWGHQKQRETIVGYRSSTTGIGLGNDFNVIDDQCRMGVGASYALTKVGTANSASQLDTITYTALLYGTFGAPEGWYVDGLGSVSHNVYRSFRKVEGPTVSSAMARAWYRGFQIGGRMGAGYRYRYFDVDVTPTISLQYTNFTTKHYTERDGASVNLFVEGKTRQSIILATGGRMRWENDIDDGKVIPELRLGLTHDFSGMHYQSTAQFINAANVKLGSPFEIRGAGVRKTGLTMGLGLNYLRSFGQLTLSYDLEKKSDFTSNTANIHYKYVW